MTIHILFGTDGIRGTVSVAPLSMHELIRLGYVLGIWACQKYGRHPSLLIAHDTRISCSFIISALQTGLLLHPVQISYAQVLPTPVAYYLTHKAQQYDCSIIISASHNPYQDNGIKIIDSSQGKLSLEDEQLIAMLYETMTHIEATYNQLGTVTLLQDDPYNYYKAYLSQQFSEYFLRGLTIVLDTAYGATYKYAPALFSHFGATVITIHDQPNGKNINDHCGSLHTDSLKKAVVAYKADAGFAFDGDGDRVIAVNCYGQEKNGDALLALLEMHPSYNKVATIVGTIMTNQGLVKQLERMHKTLIRANVGDKYVAEQLALKNLPLGGEPSGHIIIRDLLSSGDGIAVALKLLETIKITGNLTMDSFEPYPQVMFNIPVIKKYDITASPYVALKNKAEQQLLSGRIVIRYSGTENLLRIMVEDETYENAHIIATNLAQEFTKILGCGDQ